MHRPTYTYKREDGTTFEVQQRITDEPLKKCPETGQKVKRIISGRPMIAWNDPFFHTEYDS